MSAETTEAPTTLPPSEPPAKPKTGRKSIFLRRPFFTIALIVTAAYVIAAIFAPFVAPYDPVAQDMNAMMQPPTGAHPMGTDSYGQDILSRVIYGARYALVIGIFSVLIGAVGGLVIGLAAGLLSSFVFKRLKLNDGHEYFTMEARGSVTTLTLTLSTEP